MLKKIISILLIFFIQSFYLIADAKTVKVKALADFNSLNPPKYFKVEMLEPFFVETENINLEAGGVLDGYIAKVIPPKRLKQDATFVYVPTSYIDLNNTPHTLNTLVGARTPKIDAKDLVISSALVLTIGVVPTLLAIPGFFAAEGAFKAKDGDRTKSSINNAYEKSYLSIGEKGNNLHILKNEEFLLNLAVIKSQEPNYSYSPVK
ncbi:hypothetical protein IJ707_06380 [bacterium]|nr:hypothetical protein [bacterium]